MIPDFSNPTGPAGLNLLVLLKNALANIVRGSSAALVAIALPPFLIRLLPTPVYAAWILVLQLGVYISSLDLGLMLVLGRLVALTTGNKDFQERNRIVSTALAILLAMAGLAFLVLAVLALQAPQLFKDLPPDLYFPFQLALIITGGSIAVGLPATIFNGIFMGLQRNEISAVIITTGRVVGAILLVTTAGIGGGLVLMALVLALTNLFSYLLHGLACFKLVKGLEISFRHVDQKTAGKLLRNSLTFCIFILSTLLVTGLDTVIVGIFDFKAVTYYGVAASLITLIVGLHNAAFSVLIPGVAASEVKGDVNRLGQVLVTATRYGLFLLLITGLPLLAANQVLLKIWVGEEYASKSELILVLLVIANIIRLSSLPYAMLLIGTNQQSLIKISPLIEGITNIVVSVAGAALIGAPGVALGTLVGAWVGLSTNIFYNMPRTTAFRVTRVLFIREGLLRPVATFAPCIVFIMVARLFGWQELWILLAGLPVIALNLPLFINWGLNKNERVKVQKYLRLFSGN